MKNARKSTARKPTAGRNRITDKRSRYGSPGGYDAYTMEPATKDSERMFFVAREKGKNK